MPLVTRNGQPAFQKAFRENGKVVRRTLALGDEALALAAAEQAAKECAAAVKAARQADAARAAIAADAAQCLVWMAEGDLSHALAAAGCHRPNRGAWRRRRLLPGDPAPIPMTDALWAKWDFRVPNHLRERLAAAMQLDHAAETAFWATVSRRSADFVAPRTSPLERYLISHQQLAAAVFDRFRRETMRSVDDPDRLPNPAFLGGPKDTQSATTSRRTPAAPRNPMLTNPLQPNPRHSPKFGYGTLEY